MYKLICELVIFSWCRFLCTLYIYSVPLARHNCNYLVLLMALLIRIKVKFSVRYIYPSAEIHETFLKKKQNKTWKELSSSIISRKCTINKLPVKATLDLCYGSVSFLSKNANISTFQTSHTLR